MTRRLCAALLLLLWLAAAAATPPAQVQVRRWLDRTALFPGDRVTYHLDIRCPKGTDILTGDLDPALLDLDGLKLVSSRRDRESLPDAVLYHVRYTLTSYAPGTGPLQIGALVIRFYMNKAGLPPGAEAPSGRITVPAATLVMRSTLPDTDTPEKLSLRDSRAASVLSAGTAWLRPLGVALILLSALPVLLWAAPVLRRLLSGMRRQRARQGPPPSRRILEELQQLDAADAGARRAGYDRLEAALRTLLAAAAGVPADGLTAEEAARCLPGNLPVPAAELALVLEDCERARYGRDAQLPAPDRFETGVTVLARLLAAVS